MSVEFVWSNACQEQWQLAHEYVVEKDGKSIAVSILGVILALQVSTPNCNVSQLIPFVAQRLRKSDSPIYLLAKKVDHISPQGNFCLPVLVNNVVQLVPMQHQLFIQLENFAQHNALIVKEWESVEKHQEALANCGFLFTDDLNIDDNV